MASARKTSDTTSLLAQPVTAPVPQAFSPAQWANLAELLAAQDVVVLPLNPRALTQEDSDASAERGHRKASGLALLQHWASMGFVVSKADALAICQQDATAHAWLHKHVTPALKKRLGGHVRMTPMYPNFPKQVMKMDEAELLFNALVHYVGDYFGLHIVPATEEKVRKKLPKHEGQERALQVADLAGVREVLSQLVGMNTAWSPAQAELAKQALPLLLEWQLVGPKTAAPQRENQAHLMGAWLGLLRQGKVEGEAWPAAKVSTTDLLRAAVAYSGGHPSLAKTGEKVRLARLSRPQRRVLMKGLERAVAETPTALEDLFAQRGAWLALAERLHVGEWKAMPKAQSAIDVLRNQDAPLSWRGELDAVLAQAPTAKAVARLDQMARTNPGFFTRALRRVLVWGGEAHADALLNTFAAVASRADTPLLLSTEAAILADDQLNDRLMLPKGNVGKRYRVAATELAIGRELAQRVKAITEKAMTDRFAALPALGAVHVADGLDQVIVPKGLRETSDSVGVVTRGSQLPVGADAKIVRLFLWWKGYVDVDLSAVGVSSTFGETETCNYQALKGSGLVHSGDLVSAPDGAAEFVDIHLDKLHKNTRYVVLAANVFSGPAFSKLEECFVGWQERESGGQRGEIMELKTVVNKLQVTAPTKGFLGAVFDVQERRLMWLDLPIKSYGRFSIHHSMDLVVGAVEDFQLYAARQPKMDRLIDLHVQARGGVRVDKAKDADTVFCLTPQVAKKGQTVVPATQPRTVAATLLPSAPARGASAPTEQLEQQEGLTAPAPVKKTKVRR